MTPTDLVKIINDTKDAVDRSAFGPMFVYPDETNFTSKQCNQLAFNVFLTSLAVVLRNEGDRGGRPVIVCQD
jgi:uncharacterized protein YehS (DUF1456 family)